MSATANDFQRLTLVNAALAGKSGEKVRTSYIHGNWGESSSFQDSENCNDQVWREGCVTTTTVDTHVHKPVFFLKIDVEGHETDVFEGATKMLADFRPRHILMEYRPEQITLAKQILSYGYVAYNVREWDFFGQDGSAVFNVSFAPKGLVDLSLATKLDSSNIDEFSTALASRGCDIGCFSDLYFRSTI